MILHPGTQERYISETTVGSGVTSKEGSLLSDSVLVTLWVDSVTSGTLTVTVNTLTDNGKEVAIIAFPAINSGSVDLLLKKASISMQRFRIIATYTGVCQYEVYARAISGASGDGATKVQLVGSDEWKSHHLIVSTSPTQLLPVSLSDRSGVVVKNWSTTTNLFLAPDAASLGTGDYYPLAPRDALALDIASGSTVYAQSESGSIDVYVSETGG